MNTPKQQNQKPSLSSMSAHAEDKTLRDKQHDKEINRLAREWANYVGGLAQSRKIVREAYEAGLQAQKVLSAK